VNFANINFEDDNPRQSTGFQFIDNYTLLLSRFIMADRGGAAPAAGGRGGFGSRGDRGGDRGRGDRGRGRGRGRRGASKNEEKEWQPVTKLGRLVKSGKIKSMEEIYLHSLPIKEYQIVDFFLPKLKDEVMKVRTHTAQCYF
jgi:small subunit ribosomal protein S2e